jgi:response regulator RpfG family c-di-GMP phosphodiesterase
LVYGRVFIFSFTSSARINQLVSDPQAFEDFFKELSCVKQLEARRTELRAKNNEIARANMESHAELSSVEQRFKSVEEDNRKLKAQYDELSTNQGTLLNVGGTTLLFS